MPAQPVSVVSVGERVCEQDQPHTIGIEFGTRVIEVNNKVSVIPVGGTHACMHACMHVCMHAYIRMSIDMYTYMSIYVYISIDIYVYVYVYRYVYVY